MFLSEVRLSVRPLSHVKRSSLGPRYRKLRRSRGSALVEAALLMPLLFLMLCGTMDFGRIFYTGMAIAGAARAGVQFASFTPGYTGNFGGIEQAAKDDAANQGLAAASISVTARTFCQCVGNTSTTLTYNECRITTCTVGADDKPPSYSEVTVAYTFTTLLNWPGIPSTSNISRTARMRVQ
jgi:Flp pilus assembly protein TadG